MRDGLTALERLRSEIDSATSSVSDQSLRLAAKLRVLIMANTAGVRRKPEIEITEAEFRSGFAELLSKAPAQTLRHHAFFAIPANQHPWFDTGIELRAGEFVTIFAVGRAWLSREAGMCVYPDMQLWFRIGERGNIFRGTRYSHSFQVREAGRLFLGNYFPGEWNTRTGGIAVGTEAYRPMEGDICVLALCWSGLSLEGLKRIAAHGDVAGMIRLEIERLENPALPPEGWEYLWFLGPAEIYTPGSPAPQRPSIRCYTHQDAGILHKDVSLPLSDEVRLRWAWKVDLLPSASREDLLPNHDYLSIAVEFDNGQDLTYFWSSELPLEAGFRCPITTWAPRETHVVVRSGKDELGRWCQEERALKADYQRYVGTVGERDASVDPRVVPPPTRIVRVWLIANSMFREQVGQCEYGTIELHAGSTVITVN